jgi:hypothetical protein
MLRNPGATSAKSSDTRWRMVSHDYNLAGVLDLAASAELALRFNAPLARLQGDGRW